MTLVQYAKNRHFSMKRGWGKPWVKKPLWLDAAVYAVARYATLHSPWFRHWCRGVDRLFIEQHGWTHAMTYDTGRDSWIDAYWDGLTPQEAVDSEVENWDFE